MKDGKFAVPLEYLRKFWRTLDKPLNNCQVSLILTWSENCVLTRKVTRDGNPAANPAVAGIDNPADATFRITDAKLYAPVVSTQDDNKLLE